MLVLVPLLLLLLVAAVEQLLQPFWEAAEAAAV
jgi:hypothetical protein